VNAHFLRYALLGDAVFEAICALIFIVGASVLAEWTGWNVPPLFVAGGIVLAGVAALLYWMTQQPQINLPLARAVMLLNALFAVGGVVALTIFWGSLTDGARWLIGIITLFVGSSAVTEYAGLRALARAE
jgi:hypothetical protein